MFEEESEKSSGSYWQRYLCGTHKVLLLHTFWSHSQPQLQTSVHPEPPPSAKTSPRGSLHRCICVCARTQLRHQFPSISSFLPGCLIKTPCSPTSEVLLMQPMRLLGKVSCRCALPLRAGMSDVALFHHLLENKFISGQKRSSEFCLPRAFQKASKRIKPQGCLSKYQRNNHWQFPDSLQRASREVLY